MPIKKIRPKPTGLPGIVQDGPERFVVTRWWTDQRTGQRRKLERVNNPGAVCATFTQSNWYKVLPSSLVPYREPGVRAEPRWPDTG